MDKLTCIAIDDEPLALDVITKFCQRIGGIELHTYTDPEEGLDATRRIRPELVFLDIEMDNLNGLTIASQLPADTCFIFTTAYLNYAFEGFNLDAVDYLHKPFAFSRFEAAFAKAMRRIGGGRTQVPESIVVKQEYSNVNIPLDDILYIEAMESYSKIFRRSGGYTLSRVLLKNIGSMLPAGEFLRVHRSYIVSRAKIESYNKQVIRLITGATLPVGRQYAAEIAARLTTSH